MALTGWLLQSSFTIIRELGWNRLAQPGIVHVWPRGNWTNPRTGNFRDRVWLKNRNFEKFEESNLKVGVDKLWACLLPKLLPRFFFVICFQRYLSKTTIYQNYQHSTETKVRFATKLLPRYWNTIFWRATNQFHFRVTFLLNQHKSPINLLFYPFQLFRFEEKSATMLATKVD